MEGDSHALLKIRTVSSVVSTLLFSMAEMWPCHDA
jgi:hypothetical protein